MKLATLFAAVVMVGICGCRTKSVELKPIWPALHDLQAQAAQQQQRVDEIERDVDELKRDLEIIKKRDHIGIISLELKQNPTREVTRWGGSSDEAPPGYAYQWGTGLDSGYTQLTKPAPLKHGNGITINSEIELTIAVRDALHLPEICNWGVGDGGCWPSYLYTNGEEK